METTKYYKATIDYGFIAPEEKQLRLEKASYCATGGLAVVAYLENGEEWDVITVNLGPVPEGMAYIDTNNNPWAEKFLKKHKIAKPTGVVGHSGFCTYPLYMFDMTKFKENPI